MEVVSGLKYSATYVFRLYAGDVDGVYSGPSLDYTFRTQGTEMKRARGGAVVTSGENALYT